VSTNDVTVPDDNSKIPSRQQMTRNSDIPIENRDGKLVIYDPVRRKYVHLSPEEWVRQHLIRYLIGEKGYPKSLIAVETRVGKEARKARTDVVIYGADGRALVLAECKAAGVQISQETLEQAARYNRVIQAPILVISNGKSTLCWRIHPEDHTYTPLESLPAYSDLL